MRGLGQQTQPAEHNRLGRAGSEPQASWAQHDGCNRGGAWCQRWWAQGAAQPAPADAMGRCEAEKWGSGMCMGRHRAADAAGASAANQGAPSLAPAMPSCRRSSTCASLGSAAARPSSPAWLSWQHVTSRRSSELQDRAGEEREVQLG